MGLSFTILSVGNENALTHHILIIAFQNKVREQDSIFTVSVTVDIKYPPQLALVTGSEYTFYTQGS